VPVTLAPCLLTLCCPGTLYLKTRVPGAQEPSLSRIVAGPSSILFGKHFLLPQELLFRSERLLHRNPFFWIGGSATHNVSFRQALSALEPFPRFRVSVALPLHTCYKSSRGSQSPDPVCRLVHGAAAQSSCSMLNGAEVEADAGPQESVRVHLHICSFEYERRKSAWHAVLALAGTRFQ
jgi:hypothetical protein